MSKNLKNHEFFMRRALDLAKNGKGKVSPNPMVGAVLVKNGKILAESFHRKYGGAHAEVNLLRNVTKSQIHGATLYVTLEPCCHFGKTKPCTNFLISKGIKDIQVAMRDPNPVVAGKGILQLKNAGVRVRVGILEEDAKMLNFVFIKNISKALPLVSIKLGVSLDGKITTADGMSKYITNEQSRRRVHVMRSQVQGLLTTSETVLRDDPHLGVRYGKGKDPLRIILDSRLRTNIHSKIYRDKNVLVVTTMKSSIKQRKIFERAGVELLTYSGDKILLKKLLKYLYKRGIYHLMVEAGSTLVTSLFREGLADELILFIAPKILGQGFPWLRDLGVKNLKKIVKLTNVQLEKFAGDIMIRGKIVC